MRKRPQKNTLTLIFLFGLVLAIFVVLHKVKIGHVPISLLKGSTVSNKNTNQGPQVLGLTDDQACSYFGGGISVYFYPWATREQVGNLYKITPGNAPEYIPPRTMHHDLAITGCTEKELKDTAAELSDEPGVLYIALYSACRIAPGGGGLSVGTYCYSPEVDVIAFMQGIIKFYYERILVWILVIVGIYLALKKKFNKNENLKKFWIFKRSRLIIGLMLIISISYTVYRVLSW